MVDFISEVQEELRKDDYNRWLKKYGPFLGAVIVLIVAGTGYFQWKEYRAAEVSESTSYEFIEIVDKIGTDDTKAVTEFAALSDTGPDGYGWVSLKRAAELELAKGNKDAAIAMFDKAAATDNKKRHVQLAQLKASYVVASQGNYEDVKARLTPLINKGEPYEFLARELMAYAANKTGDLETARTHLSYIETNPGAPETIVRRAQQNLLLLNNTKEESPAEAQPAEMPSEETGAEEAAPTEIEENE